MGRPAPGREHSPPRPRRCNALHIRLGECRRNRGGQDQTNGRQTLQHTAEQPDQSLCRPLRTCPHDTNRRHRRIEQRGTIGIVMHTLKGRITVREDRCTLDQWKRSRKPCGAVCRKRYDVPCGTQRHDLARHGIGRTQREINEEVYAIRANRSSRLLRAHRSELPQRHLLREQFCIAARPRMIGVDLKAQTIIGEKIHRQQIPRTPRPEVRGEIADPQLLRLSLCRPAYLLLLSFLHALSPSLQRASACSYACSKARI